MFGLFFLSVKPTNVICNVILLSIIKNVKGLNVIWQGNCLHFEDDVICIETR